VAIEARQYRFPDLVLSVRQPLPARLEGLPSPGSGFPFERQSGTGLRRSGTSGMSRQGHASDGVDRYSRLEIVADGLRQSMSALQDVQWPIFRDHRLALADFQQRHGRTRSRSPSMRFGGRADGLVF